MVFCQGKFDCETKSKSEISYYSQEKSFKDKSLLIKLMASELN